MITANFFGLRRTNWLGPRVMLEFNPCLAQMAIMADEEKRSDTTDFHGVPLLELRAPLTGYFQKRVQEPDDVQDLVQEVFLRLATRRAEAGIENLRSYAFQVAATVLIDRNRRRAVRYQSAHVEFTPDRAGSTDIGPDRIVAGREALGLVMSAVQDLPDRTRTIFVLRRLEGMAYKEIAKSLGLSVSAVEKHMVRAAERLARLGDIR